MKAMVMPRRMSTERTRTEVVAGAEDRVTGGMATGLVMGDMFTKYYRE
jgi:hypothetical protein